MLVYSFVLLLLTQLVQVVCFWVFLDKLPTEDAVIGVRLGQEGCYNGECTWAKDGTVVQSGATPRGPRRVFSCLGNNHFHIFIENA